MDGTRATAAHWPAIERLLASSGLTLEGARDAFASGGVVVDDGAVVGCAAVEGYGTAALLRSVAVAADRRGEGIGRRLVDAAEAVARSGGATELILLTETAERWFERLGYSTIDRAAVPRAVTRSIEFGTACSASAIAMRRTIG